MSLPALTASTTMRRCQWSGTAAMTQSMFLSSSSLRYSRVAGHLYREADVAYGGRGRRDGGRRQEERPYSPGRLAACQLADLRQGQRDDRAGRARRAHARGRLERPERSDRRVGISTAPRLVAADARLGHLAERRAEAPAGSEHLRALALLEGIRYGGGGRSARPSHHRHDVHARRQRAAQAGGGRRRHPALEGWP